jgi:hypothetical protein
MSPHVAEAQVDYSSFLLLTAELLKDLGVDKIGPRAKLLHRIHKLKLAAAAAASSASSPVAGPSSPKNDGSS